ncbi:hypothetical protein QTN25_003144 [Entamoeba marina]
MFTNPFISDIHPFNFPSLLTLFPKLVTLRIDLETLIPIQSQIIRSSIKRVDVCIKENIDVDFESNLEPQIQDMLVTSFRLRDKTINTSVQRLYLECQKIPYLLSNITKYPNLKYLHIHSLTIPTEDNVKLLKTFDSSIQIKFKLLHNQITEKDIDVFREHCSENTHIVISTPKMDYLLPQDQNISFFNNSILYEKYFLPTTLIISNVDHLTVNDYTMFQYASKVNINIQSLRHNYKLALPISTSILTIQNQSSLVFDRVKVVNWKHLRSVSEIQTFDNFDIPYRCYQYEKNMIPRSYEPPAIQRLGIMSYGIGLYLFLPIVTLLYSLIFHTFSYSFAYNSMLLEISIYFMLFTFNVTMLFRSQWMESQLNGTTYIIITTIFTFISFSIFLYLLSLLFYRSYVLFPLVVATILFFFPFLHFAIYVTSNHISKRSAIKATRVSLMNSPFCFIAEKIIRKALVNSKHRRY